MSCRCKVPQSEPMHGVVKPCDSCDSCKADSNVRLCAFTVPTLEEGRYYKNSFVYVEDENTTYYIDGNRSEIPFGSRPYYIDDFDPEKAEYRNALVYDIKNSLMYIYNNKGEMLQVPLGKAEVELKEGKGIVITTEDGEYTISIDDTIATQDDLDAEAKARQLAIGNLEVQLSQEASDRAQADQGLQTQIDAIVNSSDVKDVVGTKAELDSYDTSTLGQNDIIKVLQDESEDNATTYYRWDGTKFDLVGEIGPYYTKGEMDGKLNQNLLREESTGFYTNSSTRVSLHLGRYNPVTGATGYVDKDIPNAGRNSVGILTKDDYTKFDDAANQTETNTQDISEALGQIAALDADKLGIDNILEGAGVTISKEGEGRETKLTISAEGGGVKELTTADYNWNTNTNSATEPYDCVAVWLLAPGVYYFKDTTGGTSYRAVFRFDSSNSVGNTTYYNNFIVTDMVDSAFGDGKKILAWSGSAGVAGLPTKVITVSAEGRLDNEISLMSTKRVVNNLTTNRDDMPLSAAQGKLLKEMIDAIPSGGGGSHELTAADYDWPENNPDGVALWKREPGLYYRNSLDVKVYISTSYAPTYPMTWLVARANNPLSSSRPTEVLILQFDSTTGSTNGTGDTIRLYRVSTTGTGLENLWAVQDNLTSTSHAQPLAAYQGKVLNDRLTALEQGGGGGSVDAYTKEEIDAKLDRKVMADWRYNSSNRTITKSYRNLGTWASSSENTSLPLAGDGTGNAGLLSADDYKKFNDAADSLQALGSYTYKEKTLTWEAGDMLIGSYLTNTLTTSVSLPDIKPGKYVIAVHIKSGTIAKGTTAAPTLGICTAPHGNAIGQIVTFTSGMTVNTGDLWITGVTTTYATGITLFLGISTTEPNVPLLASTQITIDTVIATRIG